jgi:hypothetical protein
VVETNLAFVTALLVVVTKVNIDGLGTTTLSVLDSGTLLLARSDVLANRLVRHLVVELEVTVELDGDLNLGDGETLLPLAAVERSWDVLLDRVLSTPGVEGPLGQVVPLAEAVGTAPSFVARASMEVEVAILAEVIAVLQVAPVETTLLLVRAVVVVVLGGVEAAGVTVPGGSHLLGGQPGDKKSSISSHDEDVV